MVCDLPVPGGPSRTKVFPPTASATARSCEESAGTGTTVPSWSRSTSGLSATGSVNRCCGVSMRCLTKLLWDNSFQDSSRSFQSGNLANCRIVRCTDSSTRKGRPASAIARRTASKAAPRSMPDASSTGSASWGICMLNATRSFSNRQKFGVEAPASSMLST